MRWEMNWWPVMINAVIRESSILFKFTVSGILNQLTAKINDQDLCKGLGMCIFLRDGLLIKNERDGEIFGGFVWDELDIDENFGRRSFRIGTLLHET
jgi:hypothetical protein